MTFSETLWHYQNIVFSTAAFTTDVVQVTQYGVFELSKETNRIGYCSPTLKSSVKGINTDVFRHVTSVLCLLLKDLERLSIIEISINYSIPGY